MKQLVTPGELDKKLLVRVEKVWLTTSQAAALEGISRQTAHKKATVGEWVVKREKISGGGGLGGTGFLIALSSLSTLAQRRWYQLNPETKTALPEEPAQAILMEPVNPGTLNLAEIKALVGLERFEELLKEAEEKAKPVKAYLKIKDRGDKTDRATAIASKYEISLGTLYRRVALYQEGGATALMRQPNNLGTGTVRRAVNEELERYVCGEYLKGNKPKVAHVCKKAQRYCETNGLEIPSRATIYRVIDELKTTKPDLVCLARDGEEEYVKRFAEKATRKEPEFVNQIWEGDHHRLDFFVNYRGKAVRPWITAWLDVTTRTMAGWALSYQANGRTIGLALRHGILAKHLSNWDMPISKAMATALTGLGWDLDKLKEIAGKPLPFNGLPQTLYIDNGEDYKAKVKKGLKSSDWEYSREVRSTTELLNIEAKFCTKYSPWAKGHVERSFGTFTDQLARYMPGYCGSDNRKRPAELDEQALAERGELLDLEEATYLVETYYYFYHNDVHGSLGMTPMQKYEMTPKVRQGMPDERTLDICLMDVEKAKVMTSGIQRFGTKNHRRYYHHPDLENYVGQTVVIRFDPNRIGELLVFNPKNGKYICTAANKELMDWEASRDDLQKFLKKRATRKKEVKERLQGYKDATLQDVVAERKENGPIMMAGNTTTPDGIRFITGMEEASKQSAKKPAQGKTKKASGQSKFDEYMRQAGNN